MKATVFFVFLYLLCHLEAAKKTSKVVIQEISDHKEFKKFMKTKTNVLVYFFDKPKSGKVINVLREVADKVKGTGAIVSVECATGEKFLERNGIEFPGKTIFGNLDCKQAALPCE